MKYMKNKYGDENGNVVSFWSTDDNVLCEDGKTLRENLDEVDTQFKDIANLSLVKHTDGKVYIKKQDGTLLGTGIEIGGSDVDLSKITMSMDGQTLKLMNDGTQIATVEIPTATVTDEQLTNIIQSKIDDGTLSALTIQNNSISEDKLQKEVIAKLNFCREIEPLFRYDDLNWKQTVRTNNDPEKNDCIYEGTYTNFIDISETKYSYIFGLGTILKTTLPSRLNLRPLFYDANKTFLGSGQNEYNQILPDDNILGEKVFLIKKVTGAKYMRFYLRNSNTNEYLNSFENVRFYKDVVTDFKMLEDSNNVRYLEENHKSIIKKNLAEGNKIVAISNNNIPFSIHNALNHINYFPIKVENNQTYYIYFEFDSNGITTNGDWRFKVGCSVLQYDELGNLLNSSKIDKDNNVEYLFGDYDANSTERYCCLKFKNSLNAKYIKFGFDIVTLSNSQKSSRYSLIVSEQPIPLHPNVENYRYCVAPDCVKQYIIDIGNDLNSGERIYKFSKLGKILPKPKSNQVQYLCHGHNMMQYDTTTNKYVCMIRGANAHSGATNDLFISFIDGKTLASTELTNIIVGENQLKWCRGFWINNNNEYILIADTTPSDKTPHRYKSTDKGSTWTDEGEISVTDGESKAFFSMFKLSNGRIIATYDDTVIKTGSKDNEGNYITKIAISDDDGVSFNVKSISCEFSTVEHTFIEIDNIIMMIGRYNAYPSYEAPAYISYSKDNGDTWSKIVKSNTIKMHDSDGIGFTHDNVVEIFTISRFTNDAWREGNAQGKLQHYTATKKQALNDEFTLREKWYSESVSYSDFTAPSLAVGYDNNVLIAHAESIPTSNIPCEWSFLIGTMDNGKVTCCDNRASDRLPYSGAKIEELINNLREELKSN